jgi:hypothetical protein
VMVKGVRYHEKHEKGNLSCSKTRHLDTLELEAQRNTLLLHFSHPCSTATNAVWPRSGVPQLTASERVLRLRCMARDLGAKVKLLELHIT